MLEIVGIILLGIIGFFLMLLFVGVLAGFTFKILDKIFDKFGLFK